MIRVSASYLLKLSSLSFTVTTFGLCETFTWCVAKVWDIDNSCIIE